MSGFLSRLKQQQAAERPSDGLTLFYGLKPIIGASGWPRLYLSLHVGKLHEGRWLDEQLKRGIETETVRVAFNPASPPQSPPTPPAPENQFVLP